MTKTTKIKMMGLGVIGALGLGSAAVAQQSTKTDTAQQQTMTPEQHRQMMSGGSTGKGQMQMGNSQMHKEMATMMASCNRMMQMMGDMPQMKGKSNN